MKHNSISSQRDRNSGSKVLMNPSAKLLPSEFLTQSLVDCVVEDYPMIIEFLNIQDNSAQVHCSYDLDKPLFKPSPNIIVFEDYAPFAVHEKKLYFRNNDKVARRIKIIQPDIPFFEVSAPRTISGQPLQQSKIAAGMEIYFLIRFKPEEIRDYSFDLTCCTEREKFLYPIRAIGERPRMTFPDEIQFGKCPVKSPARKMLLTQNIGSCTAKFHLISHSSQFTCPSEEFIVEPGGSQMIEIFFTPNGADEYQTQIEIEYTKKIRCFINVFGSGKNVDVSLSTPSLSLEPSFISLASQGTLRIKNLSDIAINFSWKSFNNAESDNIERNRLYAELNRMEEIERDSLLRKSDNGGFGTKLIKENYHSNTDMNKFNNGMEIDDFTDNSNDYDLIKRNMTFEGRAALSSLSRKYYNLRKALERDPMHFVDDIFETSPLEGVVWAKSEIEITVLFRPDTAASYSCFAYLDISGREDRIPLHISGTGIGPNAVLSCDIFDIGDVYVNQERRYDVTITNKGDIPAAWNLLPSTSRLANKFRFYPNYGVLEVGKSQVVNITFCTDILGEFSEVFSIALQGSEEPLDCVIKGQVIGPTFHFDCQKIDYGIVSFDILHVMTSVLVNTSTIPMTYKLYVPQDGTYLKKEFVIKPTNGTLLPQESVEVTLSFTPNTVKVYDYSLAIDIAGVGEAILSLPILAECIVSSVRLQSREISFGDCFIRHGYEKEMVLINNSNVVNTKVDVLAQQSYTKGLAVYTATPPVVVVPAGGSEIVIFKFRSMKLGPFKIPVNLMVSGSQEPPTAAALSCNSIGPIVEVDNTELRWGSIDCLHDFPKTLTIRNNSLIPASCKIFVKMLRSKYSLSASDIIISPHQEFELTVTANVDDTILHEDELYIAVTEGANIMIPMSARGVGTSIYCDQDISLVDFGIQLTNFSFERKITVENKGRRHQELNWINHTNVEENAARLLKSRRYTKEGKKVPKALLPEAPLFKIEPSEIVLRPRTSTTFLFKGFCPSHGIFVEKFFLESKVGKERNKKVIITTDVKAEIVEPLLEFSLKEIDFIYAWQRNVAAEIQSQELILTNSSSIALNFLLKTDTPFNLSSWDHFLQPGESCEVTVHFDPLYKDDLLSHVVEKFLIINYRGHPQKDRIPLRADIRFPNLEFDTQTIAFGSVLNDTSKTCKVHLKNWSKLDVNYEWIFLEEADTIQGLFTQKTNAKKSSSSHLPPSQVFDIRPIRSCLKPGDSEEVDFVMFGYSNLIFKNSVICKVEGGPEYKLSLHGEASYVSFAIDKCIAKFDEVIFSEKKDDFIIITNNGKVPFNFTTNSDQLSTPGIIEAIPSSGKIEPNEKLKVILRFYPMTPSTFLETFIFNIAHFDPVKIQCYGKGVFQSLALTLPRHKKFGPLGETTSIEESWTNILALARENLMFPDKEKVPPKTNGDPFHETSAAPPVFRRDEESYETESVGGRSLVSTLKLKEPSHLALDTEIHRIVFCKYLDKELEAMDSQGIPRMFSTKSLETNDVGNTKSSNKNNAKEEVIGFNVNNIIVANYMCDFGNVIFGTRKKRIFKILNNTTAGPISWVFDKQVLAVTGFTIEPDNVQKLPEGGFVEILIKYMGRGKASLGRQTVTLPIVIKNAPILNLTLSVNVCMPDLEILHDSLDFESVPIGCSKKMYTRFINKSPVTTKWNLSRPGVSKDESRFQITPSQGSIKSGHTCVVMIEFIPVDAKKIKLSLNLKIDLNTKTKRTISLSAEGQGNVLRFDQNSIELGPIFPHSVGEEKTITVFNEGDLDAELYSLDFDRTYKVEDSVLSTVDIYDADGYYRSPLRPFGHPLPAGILEAHAKLLKQKDESAENAFESEVELLISPSYRVEAEPRDRNEHQDNIVIGPLMSGVTTLSAGVGKKLDVPVLTFDILFMDVAKTNAQAGLYARMLTQTLTADDVALIASKEATLHQAAEASKVDYLESKKKEKKKKDQVEEVISTPEIKAYDEFIGLKSGDKNCVEKVITERLKWSDCGHGIVFDGLFSNVVKPTVILEALRTALPDLNYSMLIFEGGVDGYKNRLSNLRSTKVEHIATFRKLLEDVVKTSGGAATGRKTTSREPIAEDVVKSKSSASSAEFEPVGDEPWIDQVTMEVMDLPESEFKALENEQKMLYTAQLKYHRLTKIAQAEDIIKRISMIWDFESGELLKTNTAEEGQNNGLDFSAYIDEILPLVNSFFNSSQGETENSEELKPTNRLYLVEHSDDMESTEVLSILTSSLPPLKSPPRDKNAIPPPSVHQIYRRPLTRIDRKNISKFSIISLDEGKSDSFRWVIPARGSVQFKVKYQSLVQGKHDAHFGFETLSTKQTYTLFLTGYCEIPQINTNVSNIFMKRVKSVNPNNPPPAKKYITSTECYSFGPVLNFKKADWRIKNSESAEDEANFNYTLTNTDTMRISNSGKYKCMVEFGFLVYEDNPIFFLEPSAFELDEGETKELKIWSFPIEPREYSNTLVACVSNNPEPVLFEMKSWGVHPSVELMGGWIEALQLAETEYNTIKAEAKPDQKVLKEKELKVTELRETSIIEFERILIGRTDIRSFSVKNTCLLPIMWEIDVQSFGESSSCVSISPTSGSIAPGASVTISATFASSEPIVVSGGFLFKFSDCEGGLVIPARVQTRKLAVKAEAYNIQAVSLTAAGSQTNGSDIDLGKIRVGDYVTKKMKMGNLGKYRIGYKFNVKSPQLSGMLKIVPDEGLIEPGKESEIEITFCSPESDVNLKGNRDIKVQILEPLTGESVESFNLFLTVNAVFNKFRMQPAKGISFGAMRFDSDAKVKRFELKNEGDFDITYVVCPARTEVNELDVLDGPALACYAYGTPAARRIKELGANFKSRIDSQQLSAGGKAAPKKDDKKAPIKGKEQPVAVAANAIFDPDNLPVSPVPEDPLKLGAFIITPRVGVVLPGQSVGIDVQYFPFGNKAIREKLRICISGVDESSGPYQWAKSFDLSGESSIPAIDVDDIHSIFEEQEVVKSLSDLQSDDSGSSKLEKLGVGRVVYAEVEKMLAFGPVMCGLGVGKTGNVVRLKISNPTKIDTKVSFTVSDAAAVVVDTDKNAKGKGKEKDKPKKGEIPPPVIVNAFTVHPELWEIPPHEHRFVNIHFNPTEIKSYRSMFVAKVEDFDATKIGGTPEAIAEMTKSLQFELGGSGTIPCISIEQPTERDSEGCLVMSFGRLHVGRLLQKKFVLRNDGIMPATCLFEMTGSPDFVFPNNKTSVTLNGGEKQELTVSFAPPNVSEISEQSKAAKIKITVLHNPFDHYSLNLNGVAYSGDAIFEIPGDDKSEEIVFPHLNLSQGIANSTQSVLLRSRSNSYMKFQFVIPEVAGKKFILEPSVGHLAPQGVKEIKIKFETEEPIILKNLKLNCTLQHIDYANSGDDGSTSLRGLWDDSMISIRPATDKDIAEIEASAAAYVTYQEAVRVEAAKGKKGKPVAPPPNCMMKLVDSDGDVKMVQEILAEPSCTPVVGKTPQSVAVDCTAIADKLKFQCAKGGEQIVFRPTFMYQSTIYKFTVKNESNIDMPLSWRFENAKRKSTTRNTGRSQQASRLGTTSNKSTIPCPFSISSEDSIISANTESSFIVKFSPLEVDDFGYILVGETLSNSPIDADPSSLDPHSTAPLRILFKGESRRPICHFDIADTPDYLLRRPPNMKNEVGLYAPIETGGIKVVSLESIGLKCRNTFRFHVANPTSENYEFKWDACGDPSPFWRCVQGAGILFSGKQTEMIFEYLPEEEATAESFFKFTLPSIGLDQLFLFAGKVCEPRVTFSTSRIDFHNVMLGGEGGSETLYIENLEHLPFSFVFDKTTLQNMESANGSILDITPRSGTVSPNSKFPILVKFKPQEEVVYNFNITCEIKRKPNKLSVNIKGEGYAVHPLIQLENAAEAHGVSDPFITLKPAPAINYADFGAVQVLDSISKSFVVTNNGKFNFDYSWENDVDVMQQSMLALAGGKPNGTLHKGEKISFSLSFAPAKEVNVDGVVLSFVVAGKYVYNIMVKGSGVQPAIRFSFMHHDFGSCFITSPGGNTVIEEKILRITNHDPVNNISLDCAFQKLRALWVECHPAVLEPGGMIDVAIRFAPRDVKAYSFIIPFIVNGTGKVNVNIDGTGILPRLELVNAAQRRTNFGLVDVGSEVTKTIVLANKSKRDLPVQLIDGEELGGGLFSDNCVTYFPNSEFIIPAHDKVSMQLTFSPNRRIAQFAEDLQVKYAGVTRKLINVSGKAQGPEAFLDTDSLPFGMVVIGSKKVKKLSLENSGDLALSFNWIASQFGPHFSLSPMSGKIAPGNEVVFDVTFEPKFVDPDIRQENIMLTIPGLSPLQITCSGLCVSQPTESIILLNFDAVVRSVQTKEIALKNPTDKDWFISPSMSGIHWSVPNEVRVPAKGSAQLVITYFPISMCLKKDGDTDASGHQGQLFLPMPDGTAQLYKLKGYATPPLSSGAVTAEVAAKHHCMIPLKMTNWLAETQKFHIKIEIIEKPSPATFFVAANAVEVAPHGVKDFQIRFTSLVEGKTKAIVTFTNNATGEYFFYDIIATATSAQTVDQISMESPVRQSAHQLITIENPLGRNDPVTMLGDNWWSCDCKCIRVKELLPLSGNVEGSFDVEYRPLAVTQQPETYTLTIKTKELGNYIYKIVVKGLPSAARQTLHFEVPLGSVQTESFVFKTFNAVASNYTCVIKTANPFSVEKTVNMAAVSSWDGADSRIPITFEPTEIGEVNEIVTVSSPEGGVYECELVGRCVPPIPVGPFYFTNGAAQAIPFRNCFNETCTWTFIVDSPAFKVAAATASIAGKTNDKCTVTFNAPDSQTVTGDSISAKLFISCSSKPHIPPWIVYLRGKM